MANETGFEIISVRGLGNSLTTIGYFLELAQQDFSEKELDMVDKHQYGGVYAVVKKPCGEKDNKEKCSKVEISAEEVKKLRDNAFDRHVVNAGDVYYNIR